MKSSSAPVYAWDKSTLIQTGNYKNTLDIKLNAIDLNNLVHCTDINCNSTEHRYCIDKLCKHIIDCCLGAADQCIPLVKSSDKIIPGWNNHAKQEREQSLFWHWIWSESGKPYTGLIYNLMKKTRHTYHYAVRRLKKEKLNMQRSKLADIHSDNNLFWQNIKSLNPANKTIPTSVDGKQGSSEIAKLFRSKYELLYNSVPTSGSVLSGISNEIDDRLSHDPIDCYVTPYMICTCISKLKKNKSDGDRGFNSNHLIYGCHRLNVILSILFNSMMSHGYYPQELLKSTIISIPKDRSASLSNSDNYRGISLFNSMCKLFDYVIIELSGTSLSTSDMQFGFKREHSTTMCTVILKEVVNHYIDGNSNVYCCLLDASKAFDRVNFGKLFSTLLSRQMPPQLLRLIVNNYVRQQARVAWSDYFSSYFDISNGVKQGGVLSAQLFTIYIDSLLIQLKMSGYGCHISGNFMGALSYADDITLLCPSLRGLNAMLQLCSKYADNFDITFNAKKTVCIKFGAKLNGYECAILNRKTISWVDRIRHLGNYLDTTLSDKIDCKAKISAYIGYVNTLLVNFGHLQHTTICS